MGEGRDPSALFDEPYYRATYADVDADVVAGAWRSGYEHFLTCGVKVLSYSYPGT